MVGQHLLSVKLRVGQNTMSNNMTSNNNHLTVISGHSTVITKIMLLYNTEWQYDHGMAVNYRGKKFYIIGPW